MRSLQTIPGQVNLAKSIPPDEGSTHAAHERLFERLNRASLSKYVVIHAPEGYGKSSLLSAWYHRVLCRDNVCRGIWFKVDEGDCEPCVFWLNFANALSDGWEGVREKVAEELYLLQGEQPHEFFISLSNYLVMNFRRENHYTFILDNFEAFCESVSERQFIEFAELLPFNIHIIIATRSYRDTMLIRQGTYSNTSVIGVADLAFTEREAAAWLCERTGRDISVERVEALYANTLGWPLAIHAAAEDLLAGQDEQRALDAFEKTNAALMNIVFSSLTKELSARVMSFLLETAFLGSFCASLCNEVTQQQDSADIMRYLEDNSIFIIARDAERVWFSYHPLFAQWLQGQMLRLRRYQLRSLNFRAGQWYRARNLYLPATRHIIAASEGGFVSMLAETGMEERLPASESYLLWLFELAEESLEANLPFCMLAAWAYAFSGRPDDALYWASRSRQCAQSDEVSERMDIALQVIEAKCHTLSGDFEAGISLSLALLDETAAVADDPLRMVLLQNLAEAYEQKGEIALAMKKYAKANSLARMNGSEFLTGFTRYQSICLQYRQGNLRAAEDLCRLALAECPPDFTVYGALCAALGLIQLTQNKVEEAAVYFKRASQRASIDRNIDIYLEVCAARSLHLIASCEYSEAQLALSVAAHAVRSCIDVPPRGVAHVPFAYSAMLYLLLGDVESAQEAIDEYLGLEMPETVICSIEIKYMQLRIALAQGADPNKVLEQLDDLNRKAQECGMALLMLDIHLLEASVQHGLHDRHCAMKSIRKALDLARPEQILRPFLLGGEPVRLLLAEALGAHMGFEVERFVRRIIRAFDDERTRVSQVSSMTMEVPSVRGQIGNSPDFARWNLTIREREVACSLLRGMNRKEIASEFCTSQNTVKSHISHIYEKVGVHSVSELLKMFAEYEVCVN